MPYANAERQREAVQTWRHAHPEKVKLYKRKGILIKAIKERRLPNQRSIKHHALTKEDLMTIVASVLRADSNGSYASPGEVDTLLFTQRDALDFLLSNSLAT